MSDDQAAITAWLAFFASLNEDPYFPPYHPACSRSWAHPLPDANEET